MAKSVAEGVGDGRTYTVDPYRRESPSTQDASAGRTRKAARSGIQGTGLGTPKSKYGSKGN